MEKADHSVRARVESFYEDLGAQLERAVDATHIYSPNGLVRLRIDDDSAVLESLLEGQWTPSVDPISLDAALEMVQRRRQGRLRAEFIGFSIWGVAGGLAAASVGLDKVYSERTNLSFGFFLGSFGVMLLMFALRYPKRAQWVGAYTAELIGGLVFLAFAIVPPVSWIWIPIGLFAVYMGYHCWFADGFPSELVLSRLKQARSTESTFPR